MLVKWKFVQVRRLSELKVTKLSHLSEGGPQSTELVECSEDFVTDCSYTIAYLMLCFIRCSVNLLEITVQRLLLSLYQVMCLYFLEIRTFYEPV